jgi:ATP-dependent DNA helicase RecQ
MTTISKHIFLNALDCHTRGWFLHNEMGVSPPTPAELIRMRQGQEIHRLARERLPDGVFVGDLKAEKAINRTRELLQDQGTPVLFEPYFKYGRCVTRADSLSRRDDGWSLEEVKSSLGQNPGHLDDMAYTTMVMQGAGVHIREVMLTLVNKEYRHGSSEVPLLWSVDVTEDVFGRAAEFEVLRPEIELALAAQVCPEATLIWACRGCEFFADQCVGKGIREPIFEVPRIGANKFNALLERGVTEIAAVPADFELSGHQRRVVDSVQAGEMWVSEKLTEAIDTWEWPLLYLDFETVSTCLPLYEGLGPYNQIPTQYSLHIRSGPTGPLEHRDYLADGAEDCRREFAELLLADLGTDGNIVVYSSFEKTILTRLQEWFDDLADPLERVKERLVDLQAIIKNHIWHPEFRGSTSIKRTLPVLVPEMDYSDLEIANGDQASAAFYNMATGRIGPDEQETTRASLLLYCERDTLAMVKLHDALVNVAGREQIGSDASRYLRILKTTFGHDKFREYQEEIIQHVCDGNDVLAVLATGYGKSICYQIPALALEGTAIVISPLISLMRDQVDALLQHGVKAAFINSTQNYHEQEVVRKSVAAGRTEILYLAPERIVTDDMAHFLSRQAISLIAIDEAHCVSRWGPSFREDYLALDALADLFPGVPRIALTATADAQTRSDVVEKLRLNDAQVFVGGFDRTNLRYEVAIKQAERGQLMDFLSAAAGDAPGIVYCRTRARTEKVAAWMTEWGYQALAYHAGLSPYERSSAQRAFRTGENVVIVATIAFGMGIDKPDVRFVVHMDLPKTIESYHQETGRAGRDGASADLLMLYGDADAAAISRFIFEAESPEEFKAVEFAKLQALLGYCETTGCRREALLRYFDEEYSGPCGNCDNCEETPEAIDGTGLATLALECVPQTGQRFGTNYLVDVLLGSRNERVLANGHERADIYGAGRETGRKEWRSVYRQLIAQGCIELVYDSFPVLRLNDRSRRIMKGEETVRLRRDRTGISSKYTEAAESGQVRERQSDYVEIDVEHSGGGPDDGMLFSALKKLRRRLALEHAVPPYVIFHDSTLHEMVDKRPSSPEAFLDLKGVGEVKVRRYGTAFLRVINGE